jgi:cytochrome c
MPPLPTTNLEKEKTMTKIAMNSGAATVFLTLALTMTNAPLSAQEQTGTMPMDMPMMSTGLVLPRMDPVQGRALFASKGCVVCHSINGVGGTDAPMLDAEFMDLPMNPFEFAARMWRGAAAMVDMQRDELGGQIELNGEELAAIIAFVHDANEQKKFSEKDIPENIMTMMNKME